MTDSLQLRLTTSSSLKDWGHRAPADRHRHRLNICRQAPSPNSGLAIMPFGHQSFRSFETSDTLQGSSRWTTHQTPARSSCQSSPADTQPPHPHHSRSLSESSMSPELCGIVSALQAPLDPPKHPHDEEMQVNLLLEASPPPSPLVIEELETPLAKGRAEEVAGLQSLTLACVPPPRRYLTLVSQGHCLVPCPSGARETGPGQNTQGQFQGLDGVARQPRGVTAASQVATSSLQR